MKLNIKKKIFGNPAFCFRCPVPGQDPPFEKRWPSVIYTLGQRTINPQLLILL